MTNIIFAPFLKTVSPHHFSFKKFVFFMFFYHKPHESTQTNDSINNSAFIRVNPWTKFLLHKKGDSLSTVTFNYAIDPPS